MVSLIVPLYNSASFIDRLTECLVNQTYDDIEIIYVNDGSPDDSLKYAKRYQKSDSRIKIIDKKNAGQAAALNDGISLAQGEYLMFLDADDTVSLEACESAMEIISRYQVDMIFWPHTREFRNSGRSELGPRFFLEEKHFKTEADMQFLRRRMIGLLGEELRNPISTDYFNAGWGKLYRSSIIKQNNIKWTDTKEVGSSDVLFNAQLMPHIRSAYYLPEYLHQYTKDNQGSLTKTYGWGLFEKLRRLHAELEMVIETHYSDNPEFKKALDGRRALSIINLSLSVSRYFLNKNSTKEMNSVLREEKYKRALKNLQLKYMPLHFRFFFIVCRMQWTFAVLLLGRLMRLLR